MIHYIVEPKIAAVGWGIGGMVAVAEIATPGNLGRWLAPGWLALILLLLMTIELVTCYYATAPHARPGYAWERHISSKLLLVMLVVVSLAIDSMILVALTYFPAPAAGFPAWASGFLPITLSTLVWLNTAEAVRSIGHIAQETGETNIPPVVLWVIRQIRKADLQRLPPGAVANKRMIDDMTEDDIAEFLQQMDKRRRLDPPPPPLGTGDEPHDTAVR